MTFSTKQYSWSDVTVAFGGRIVEGITNAEYTSKMDKDYLRGRGAEPHGIVRGNKEYNGTLELWQSEVEAMTADAPSKDLLKLNFDVVIAYVPEEGGQTVVDTLKGVEFTEIPKGMKQGDKNKLITLPIIITKVLPQE